MGMLGSLGSMFGIGGDQGEYYQGAELNNKGTKSLAEMLDAARGTNVNNAGKAMVGGQSLADALKGLNGDESAALASSPIYGKQVAEQQVQNDPLLSGIFNKGGSRDNALADENRLATQGFQLTPQDKEAYGQASGNIARTSAQSDQSLASALAARGLSAGGNSGAIAQFTGNQGNKNEPARSDANANCQPAHAEHHATTQ